jgi:hypothetical protein
MLGEDLDLETIISSSLEKFSTTYEFTFIKALPFRETKQHVKKKRVQN